jgi:hypothetical protein
VAGEDPTERLEVHGLGVAPDETKIALDGKAIRGAGTDQRSIRTPQRVFRRGRYGASAG